MGRIHLVLIVAFVVSVIHYVDNYVNYAAYPEPTRGPVPSATLIAASWFLFTAFAVGALLLLHSGRRLGAALCLAAYSVSGLVGLGHYTVPGATSMPLWRQAHIVVDIGCGVVLLTLAIWLVRTREPATT